MNERINAVTLHGKPITLVGSEVSMGEIAPDAELIDNEMKPVKLSDFRGKVVVISSVPSLDTPVCDRQTRRFNEEAAKLGDNVKLSFVPGRSHLFGDDARIV